MELNKCLKRMSSFQCVAEVFVPSIKHAFESMVPNFYLLLILAYCAIFDAAASGYPPIFEPSEDRNGTRFTAPPDVPYFATSTVLIHSVISSILDCEL